MPDLHKTLILAHITELEADLPRKDELAIATEHAPFPHRNAMKRVGVGQQTKKQKTDKEGIDEVCEKAT
jgi:hypothetical protein